MACLSESPDRPKACCENCENDELQCPDCCRCVPRYLCIGFYPDDLDIEPSASLVNHYGDGAYVTGLGISVSVAADVSGACAWIVDGQTEHGIYEEFPVYEYGCLTQEGELLQVEGVTISGQVGTLIIEMYRRVRVPTEVREGGCVRPVCTNCVCLPRCICLRQSIHYEDEDPPNQEWSDETTQRRFIACWDEDVGYMGGWHVEIPEDTSPSCFPAYDILIEIVDAGDGTCKLQATVNGEGPKDSEIALDCDGFFNGSWGFDEEDPIDPELPAEMRFSIVSYDCGRDSCPIVCCPSFPPSLVAIVQGYSTDGDICSDAFEVDLTRQLCSASYTGTVVDFPWECEDDGPGLQNLSIRVNPCAPGCQASYVVGKCVCSLCTGLENPGVSGCGEVTQFSMSHPIDPDFGSIGSAQQAKCGRHTGLMWPGGEFVVSSCDPVYQEFNIPLGGIGDCCDRWHVIVTE